MVFYNELMIIIGGRGHHSNNNASLPTEIYNTETCELFKFAGIPMNRQVSFIYQTNIFLYGGFNSKTPTQSIGNLSRISLEKWFLENFIEKMISRERKDLHLVIKKNYLWPILIQIML